jgi:hypothetical protein
MNHYNLLWQRRTDYAQPDAEMPLFAIATEALTDASIAR